MGLFLCIVFEIDYQAKWAKALLLSPMQWVFFKGLLGLILCVLRYAQACAGPVLLYREKQTLRPASRFSREFCVSLFAVLSSNRGAKVLRALARP